MSYFSFFEKKKKKETWAKWSVSEKLFCLLGLSMLFFFDVRYAVVVVLRFN